MPLASRPLVGLAVLFLAGGCPSKDPEPVWSPAFDTARTGALSGVWGSGPDNVFIVGGGDTAEIYHFDGADWAPMTAPDVGLLVWVFGFGPDDVWAVGVGGGVIHYQGSGWTVLDPGTTTDLWGVWGTSSTDLWIVGGSVSAGDPIILHYDGDQFTPFALDPAENPLGIHALFKIFGVGSKLFAVGQQGMIVGYDGSSWTRVPAGVEADDDFIALYGVRDDAIVAVGGRNTARIAIYDGTGFETIRPRDVFGLNAIFVDASGRGFIGGVPGFVAELDIEAREVSRPFTTSETVHAMWGDDQGRVYAVGGLFVSPFNGIAMVRTEE